jgi:hypothetical protein
LKALAKRGFGCTAYDVRRAAFIFVLTERLKHPRGNEKKKKPRKTGSLVLKEEYLFFSQNARGVIKGEGRNYN